MSQRGFIEQVGDYVIREQGFMEIQSDPEVQFTLCGINPYGYYENVRRFVADLDGEIVGEGWTLTSRHGPWGRLGHYGMFEEEHKRKGLGGRLLKLCIDAVGETGVEAMFIDTGPSIAHQVYEKYGFRDVVQDHPEWLGLDYGGRTIQEHLEIYYRIRDCDPLKVRTLNFSHLNEIQVLLNSALDPDVLVKNYLLTLFEDDQLHEGQILVEIPKLSEGRPETRRVRMLGLFAGSKLIGFSTLAPWRTTRWDNRHEAHIGLMDMYLRRGTWRLDRCRVLFDGIRDSALDMGFCRLRTMETPRQTVKTGIFQALGFRAGYEMPGALVMGVGTPDRGAYPGVRTENLAAYEIALDEPGEFTHPYRVPWDY